MNKFLLELRFLKTNCQEEIASPLALTIEGPEEGNCDMRSNKLRAAPLSTR